MAQRDRWQDHIVDDSGHNFDEAVINILNDHAHEPDANRGQEEVAEQIESFFDLPDDL